MGPAASRAGTVAAVDCIVLPSQLGAGRAGTPMRRGTPQASRVGACELFVQEAITGGT